MPISSSSSSTSRSFAPHRRLALVWSASASALAAIVCCVPDRFDNLTGGAPPDAAVEASGPLVEDQTVLAPRPLGPLSVSAVSSLRPRFRWELPNGTTGARIELCRARTFQGEKVTFDVVGTEGSPAEDLTPGFWFWRLVGTTTGSVGTVQSPTWEILVRPKAPSAAKDVLAPNRSIVDINGDGFPDFVTVADVEYGRPDGGTDPVIVLLRGRADGTSFDYDDQSPVFLGEDTGFGVTDIDGDGFSDLTFSSDIGAGRQIISFRGSGEGFSRSNFDPITTPPLREVPRIAELGDIDGDGHGDIGVSTRTVAFNLFGTARGLGPIAYLFDVGPFVDAGATDGGPPVPAAPLPLAGAFGYDLDPYSEFAMADPYGESPFLVFLGKPDRAFEVVPFNAPPESLPRLTTGLTAGDYDGDGLGDVAFAATLPSGKTGVCVALAIHLETPEQKLTCWEPSAPIADLGTVMTSGDLDEDGKDELLVGTSTGVEILRLGTELVAEHLATPYRARLTTVHPGRPGPAIWAGLPADGTSIGVFKGNALASTIALPPGVHRFRSGVR